MSKKTIRIIGSLVILTILIFITSTIIIPKLKPEEEKNSEQDADEKTKQVKATPVLVEAAPAFRSELIIRISASGQTEAIRHLTICPKIGGEIAGLPVREGQFVNKGDLLIRLDDAESQLELADARNNLLTARGEYEIKKIDRKTLHQLIDSTATQKYLRSQTE